MKINVCSDMKSRSSSRLERGKTHTYNLFQPMVGKNLRKNELTACNRRESCGISLKQDSSKRWWWNSSRTKNRFYFWRAMTTYLVRSICFDQVVDFRGSRDETTQVSREQIDKFKGTENHTGQDQTVGTRNTRCMQLAVRENTRRVTGALHSLAHAKHRKLHLRVGAPWSCLSLLSRGKRGRESRPKSLKAWVKLKNHLSMARTGTVN